MFLPRVFYAPTDSLARRSDEHGQSLLELGVLMALTVAGPSMTKAPAAEPDERETIASAIRASAYSVIGAEAALKEIPLRSPCVRSSSPNSSY